MKNAFCVRIKIHGQVQGVFFRTSAKEKADELGVFGWARNLDDGSVEIMAEENPPAGGEKLKEFLDWCKKGSKFAKVEKMDVEWHDDKGKFKDFRII